MKGVNISLFEHFIYRLNSSLEDYASCQHSQRQHPASQKWISPLLFQYKINIMIPHHNSIDHQIQRVNYLSSHLFNSKDRENKTWFLTQPPAGCPRDMVLQRPSHHEWISAFSPIFELKNYPTILNSEPKIKVTQEVCYHCVSEPVFLFSLSFGTTHKLQHMYLERVCYVYISYNIHMLQQLVILGYY
jgi:hypothetical protein